MEQTNDDIYIIHRIWYLAVKTSRSYLLQRFYSMIPDCLLSLLSNHQCRMCWLTMFICLDSRGWDRILGNRSHSKQNYWRQNRPAKRSRCHQEPHAAWNQTLRMGGHPVKDPRVERPLSESPVNYASCHTSCAGASSLTRSICLQDSFHKSNASL